MRKKIWVERTKVNEYWVTVWAWKYFDHYWKGGMIISKSMRASNDWWHARKNKRVRRHYCKLSNAPISAIFASFRLMRKLIIKLPIDTLLIVELDDHRRQAIAKYIERFGFIPMEHEGELKWFLKVLQKRGEEYYSVRTNKTVL